VGSALLPSVPDLAAYRRLHGDPAVWLDAITEVCRRHDLDADDAYAECTGTNVVFRVRDGPWIKLFPPLWPMDALRERTGLAAVRDVPDLEVPRLLHDGTLEGWPYVVLSHVEGVAVGTRWPDLSAEERVGIAQQLGALMARLHAVDPASCAPIAQDWSAWVSDARAQAVARQRARGIDETWASALAAYVEALPPMGLPDGGRPVFLHADLTDDHVLVQRRDGQWHVTGLIDFADAMVGDRLYDFAAPLVFLCQHRSREQRALLAGYGWDLDALAPERLERMTAWCLLHRFASLSTYARLTPGGRPGTLVELVRALRPRATESS